MYVCMCVNSKRSPILFTTFSSITFFTVRENNFTVGLTNNSPSTMNPIVYGYWLCGQWPGVAPGSATMFVPCNVSAPAARYVVIRGYADALNICEVEVYAISGNVRHEESLATVVETLRTLRCLGGSRPSVSLSSFFRHMSHVAVRVAAQRCLT